MIWWRQADESDAGMIVPLLRPADRLEVMRMGEGDPEGVLRRTIRQSDDAGVFFDRDRLLCAFGIVRSLDVGHPWLIGTEYLSGTPKAFLRGTRLRVQEWKQEYRLLTNWIDAEYPQAIRWLQWLGFTIGQPEPIGLYGAMFCRAEMRGV